MNTRLAIAIAAALLVPLGAATPELGIAHGSSGELRIALRIRPPGDVGAGLPNYEASIRRALLETGTPRGIALASMPAHGPATREDATIGNDRVVHAAALRAGKESLEVDLKRSTILGNVTSTPILVAGSGLPQPWETLNVIA